VPFAQEKRVVSQLLTLMDGIKGRGQACASRGLKYIDKFINLYKIESNRDERYSDEG